MESLFIRPEVIFFYETLQLTLAIDLAQTEFECCAINSDINYDTSLWRLQSYGNLDWTVPLTCCRLQNRMDPFAYLDPKPENLTLCQSLQKHEHNKARHRINCLDPLDEWYRMHYTKFLTVSAAIAMMEFTVLLSVILSCSRIGRRRVRMKTTGTTMSTNVLVKQKRIAPQPQPQLQVIANENIYDESANNESAIRPYHMSRSYLV